MRLNKTPHLSSLLGEKEMEEIEAEINLTYPLLKEREKEEIKAEMNLKSFEIIISPIRVPSLLERGLGEVF